ncbi:FMN-dependent NADH-azoreductase [Roseateles sp. P5_E11]
MKHLLYIEVSPRKTQSASIDVAKAFIQRCEQRHPKSVVVTLDLWSLDLPEVSAELLEAKYAGINGTPLTPVQQHAWERVKLLGQAFHAADHILLSVPLWNFGIPYKLKHLIDAVSHKDILFSFSPEEGARGLLGGKAATLVLARGLDYAADGVGSFHSLDFQKPYLEAWLKFVGIERINTITVDKTLYGPEVNASVRESARREAITVVDGLD